MIHWIERGPDLLEARAVLPDGRDIYAGYVAASPDQRAWRGYVGSTFSPVGMGPLTVIQHAVAQMVAEIVDHTGTQERPIYRDTARPLNSTMAAETDTHGVI